MGFICRYYRFLDSPPGDFEDKVRQRPGARYVDHEGKRFTVNLIGTASELHCARVDFPVDSERFSDEDASVIQLCLEHLLAILRIAYDPAISYWAHAMWMFDDMAAPELGFHIRADETKSETFVVDYENIGNVFTSAFRERVGVKHLSDSVSPSVPLRYRFLSACQVLEEHFGSRGKLDVLALAAFLKANSSLSKAKYLAMRAKCAHTVPNGKERGFLELSNKDALALNEALPEIQRLAAIVLNDRLDGDVQIGIREQRSAGAAQ